MQLLLIRLAQDGVDYGWQSDQSNLRAHKHRDAECVRPGDKARIKGHHSQVIRLLLPLSRVRKHQVQSSAQGHVPAIQCYLAPSVTRDQHPASLPSSTRLEERRD